MSLNSSEELFILLTIFMEDIIMSKWRKPLKNKRRFDARYFLNERVNVQEEVVENSVQQEELKKNFHDFSFNNWLDEGADKGTPSWDNDGKIDYEGDVSDEDVFEEGEEEGPIGKAEESPRYDEPMEELVVPGVMPKEDGDAKGMTPREIAIARAKERAKNAREKAKKQGLGPVVDEA